MISLMLSVALAADSGPSWTRPSAVRDNTPWVVLGSVGWAPIGAATGAIAGLAMPKTSSLDTRVGVGAAVGTLVGIGVGALLGLAAQEGWDAGKWSVLIPLAVELAAVVAAGCVGYLWLKSL